MEFAESITEFLVSSSAYVGVGSEWILEESGWLFNACMVVQCISGWNSQGELKCIGLRHGVVGSKKLHKVHSCQLLLADDSALVAHYVVKFYMLLSLVGCVRKKLQFHDC